MSKPDWSEVLPTPPAGGSLSEAWFTTFDQPDAGFLVEHLLPSLRLNVRSRRRYRRPSPCASRSSDLTA